MYYYYYYFWLILQQIYSLGARKVIVASVGPIGCIPYQLARFSGNNSTRCNENINKAIVLFNSGLRKLVDQFNGGQLAGSKFILVDSYRSSNDLYMNGTNNGNYYLSNLYALYIFHDHEPLCFVNKSYSSLNLGMI